MSKHKLDKQKVNIIHKIFYKDFSYDLMPPTPDTARFISFGYTDLISSTNVSGTRFISSITLDIMLSLRFHPDEYHDFSDYSLPQYCMFILMIYRQGDNSSFEPLNPVLIESSTPISDIAFPIGYPQNDIVGTGIVYLTNSPINAISEPIPDIQSQLFSVNGICDNSNMLFSFPGTYSLDSGDSLRLYFYVPKLAYFEYNPYRQKFNFDLEGLFRCAVSF